MLFRWYDPVREVTVQFFCTDRYQFESELARALQEFRLNNRVTMGTSYYYPIGRLELFLDGRWTQIKDTDRFKPGQPQHHAEVPSRGAFILNQEPPDDSIYYKQHLDAWWSNASKMVKLSIQRQSPATESKEKPVAPVVA